MEIRNKMNNLFNATIKTRTEKSKRQPQTKIVTEDETIFKIVIEEKRTGYKSVRTAQSFNQSHLEYSGIIFMQQTFI